MAAGPAILSSSLLLLIETTTNRVDRAAAAADDLSNFRMVVSIRVVFWSVVGVRQAAEGLAHFENLATLETEVCVRLDDVPRALCINKLT